MNIEHSIHYIVLRFCSVFVKNVWYILYITNVGTEHVIQRLMFGPLIDCVCYAVCEIT